MRRRRERARRHRQIPQAGVELIGSAAPDGDVEVLSVATAALRHAGLSSFVVDLGHARIAGSLIEHAPAAARAGLVEALALKDRVALELRAHACGLPARLESALVALVDLYGGEDVWQRAEMSLHATPAERALDELHALWQKVSALALAPSIVIDLGETRNFAYYTGMMFQILAEGPGAPIGSGGRYDGLLAKFRAPRPAAGFALDLDNLGWALQSAGTLLSTPVRLLVCGGSEDDRLRALEHLRARGIASAAGPEAGLEYARAWRYTHLLELDAGGALCAIGPGSRELLGAATSELCAEVAARKLAELAAAPGPEKA